MNLFASDLPDDDVGDSQVPGSGRLPPHARTPRTDGRPPSLDDWGAPSPPERPRRWLLVAALVPWVVVVAVLLSGSREGVDPVTSPPTPTPASTGTAPADPTSAEHARGA